MAFNQQQFEAALDQQGARKKAQALPYFYGDKAKDGALTGRLLIEKIERAATVVNPAWNDARKISELESSFQEKALVWYHGIQFMKLPNFATSWAVVKEAFLRVYDSSTTLDSAPVQIDQLHAKPNECIADYYGRSAQCFRVAMERLPAADKTCSADDIAALAAADDNDALTAEANRQKEASNLRIFQYFQRMLFINGLPAYIRPEIQNKKLESISEVYNACLEYEASHSKTANKVQAIQINAVEADEDMDVPFEEQEPEDEAHLNAINLARKKKKLPFKPRPDFWRNGKPAGPGGANKADNGKMKCRYCKKIGHQQKECRSRIRDGAPMVDQFGKPWANQNGNGSKKVHTVQEEEEEAAPGRVNSVSISAAALNSLRVV